MCFYHVLLICPSDDGYLGYVHLCCLHHAALNMGIQICASPCFQLVCVCAQKWKCWIKW